MRYLIHLLIFLIPFTARSEWYCNQVASEWLEKGRTLSSCGVGYGKNEDEARVDAFESAKKEFNIVCGKETACAGRVINIDPQKSDCSSEDGKFTCRRLFYFHVTDEFRTVEETPIVVAPTTPVPTTIEKKTEINNIHNNYTIINQPTQVVPRGVAGGVVKYKQFVRSAGPVKIYETNHRGNQGIYLTNPSDTDLERAIKRASRAGSMNHIYILRN